MIYEEAVFHERRAVPLRQREDSTAGPGHSLRQRQAPAAPLLPAAVPLPLAPTRCCRRCRRRHRGFGLLRAAALRCQRGEVERGEVDPQEARGRPADDGLEASLPLNIGRPIGPPRLRRRAGRSSVGPAGRGQTAAACKQLRARAPAVPIHPAHYIRGPACSQYGACQLGQRVLRSAPPTRLHWLAGALVVAVEQDNDLPAPVIHVLHQEGRQRQGCL